MLNFAMNGFLLSTEVSAPLIIALIAFAAVSVLLLVMMLTERSRRIKAQARATWLASELKNKPEAPEKQPAAPLAPTDNAGAIHTIKEASPTEIEFDPRIDPTPMGVVAKVAAPDEDDFEPIPAIQPKKNSTSNLENRLTVEEEPVWASAPKITERPLEPDDEELFANDNVYSDDKLLIGEDDANEGDVILIPKEKKQKKVRKSRNRRGLINSFVVEESYDPLVKLAPAAKQIVEEKPAEEIKEEPKPIPDVAPKAEPRYTPARDTLIDIASAFSAIADIGKKEPSAEEKAPLPTEEKKSVADKKPVAPKANKKEENPRAAVEELAKRAAKYADPADMFEKFPYKQPVNIEPNVHAFSDKVGVPASLELSMKERDPKKPAMFINVGDGNPNDRTLEPAIREGDVELKIFLNSEIENELEEARKDEERKNSYEIECVNTPASVEYEVSEANAEAKSVFTVEDARTPEALSVEESTPVMTAPSILKEEPAVNTAPRIVIEEAPAPSEADDEIQEILVVEETPVTVAPQAPAEEEESYLINGEVVQVRYRSSFASRLIQAPDEVQGYYSALKNEILAYDGIKVKNSWNYESFNREGEQCVKLNVRGRSVMIYLALNPSDYRDTKYRFKDMSGTPKFEKVPMLLSVRTERGLKYAIELIGEVMKKLGAVRGKLPTVDYRMPYEENSALALRGLVKLILPDGVSVDKNSEIVPVNVGDFINSATGK